MRLFFRFLFFIFIVSCNRNDKNNENKNFIEDTISKKNDSKSLGFEDAIDSVIKIKIDTSTLAGKRQKIINNFLIRNRLQLPDYDKLMDLNYDGFKDYVIGYYGLSGTGLKNRIDVFIYNPELSSYVFNKQLSNIMNPTFYINEKKITGFYIANGGGNGEKLEWINNKWIVTKEFNVDFDGDMNNTEWKINYPLLKKTEIKIIPYQFIPPHNVMETDIKE